jgi:hypothetical protein
MYRNGGPIILLQIENEYGNVEDQYGENGLKYINWSADLANSLNVGIPWLMCVTRDHIPTLINTQNGFYADNWIKEHWVKNPDQPAMFTEHWTGWFARWYIYPVFLLIHVSNYLRVLFYRGKGKFVRPAEDIAFSSARFIARGGSLVNCKKFINQLTCT